MTYIGQKVVYTASQVENFFNFFKIKDKSYVSSKEYFEENELSEKMLVLGVKKEHTPSFLREKYAYSINDLAIALGINVTYRDLFDDESLIGLLKYYDESKPKEVKLYGNFGQMFTEEQKDKFVKDAAYYRLEKIKEQTSDLNEVPVFL